MWKTLSSQHMENPITTHYWFVASSYVYAHPKLSMLFRDMVFSPLLQGHHSHSFIAFESCLLSYLTDSIWDMEYTAQALATVEKIKCIIDFWKLEIMGNVLIHFNFLHVKMHSNICQKPHWKTLIFTEDIGWVVITLICSSVIKDLSRSFRAYFYE